MNGRIRLYRLRCRYLPLLMAWFPPAFPHHCDLGSLDLAIFSGERRASSRTYAFARRRSNSAVRDLYPPLIYPEESLRVSILGIPSVCEPSMSTFSIISGFFSGSHPLGSWGTSSAPTAEFSSGQGHRVSSARRTLDCRRSFRDGDRPRQDPPGSFLGRIEELQNTLSPPWPKGFVFCCVLVASWSSCFWIVAGASPLP